MPEKIAADVEAKVPWQSVVVVGFLGSVTSWNIHFNLFQHFVARVPRAPHSVAKMRCWDILGFLDGP